MLVNNQLEAQFSFRACSFQICTCFEHSCARNMYRFGTDIYEKRIVGQVGYLPELYRAAWSTKYNKKRVYLLHHSLAVKVLATVFLSRLVYFLLCSICCFFVLLSNPVSLSILDNPDAFSDFRLILNAFCCHSGVFMIAS